ncbi:MAG: zf-HC2 domain-containing protein [Eubacterium sp.]|nr:zf-HC2 domain-containing protein [Eubacterium sp.]
MMDKQEAVMDCKEAEKKIPFFLDDELDGRELAEFVEHIEECPDCKEELSIQFLVTEGMERLEQGNNFNLQEALLLKLGDAGDKIRLNRLLRDILLCLETAVAAVIIAALIIVTV